MKIRVDELSKEHPAVRAAHLMVKAHESNETLVPALEEVHEEFPELTPDQIVALWLGVNAKNIHFEASK